LGDYTAAQLLISFLQLPQSPVERFMIGLAVSKKFQISFVFCIYTPLRCINMPLLRNV